MRKIREVYSLAFSICKKNWKTLLYYSLYVGFLLSFLQVFILSSSRLYLSSFLEYSILRFPSEISNYMINVSMMSLIRSLLPIFFNFILVPITLTLPILIVLTSAADNKPYDIKSGVLKNRKTIFKVSVQLWFFDLVCSSVVRYLVTYIKMYSGQKTVSENIMLLVIIFVLFIAAIYCLSVYFFCSSFSYIAVIRDDLSMNDAIKQSFSFLHQKNLRNLCNYLKVYSIFLIPALLLFIILPFCNPGPAKYNSLYVAGGYLLTFLFAPLYQVVGVILYNEFPKSYTPKIKDIKDKKKRRR